MVMVMQDVGENLRSPQYMTRDKWGSEEWHLTDSQK
jgi:hypothetical protein